MRSVWSYLTLSFGVLFISIPLAQAQSALDFAVGGGTAFDSTNHAGIDNANSITNAFGPCTPGTGDVNCQGTAGLSGFFLGFSGDIMFKEHFGAGAEINFQPVHQNYGPLQSRQTFVDINGIYEPIKTKRAILQLQGGIGSASTSFIYSQSSCVGAAVVCGTSASPVGSATHFQVHFGAGLQIPLSEHFFVRPQFDLHYVPGLTNQFSSTLVPEATVWLGYHFGER
jgi:hypothetical protein